MKRIQKKMKGFSLVEVLLSMVVLTVGLLPILSSMNKGLNASFGSRDMIVASELSQEGIELVKNVKDNGILAGNKTLDFLVTAGQHVCRIDYTASELNCATASYDLTGTPLGHSGASGKFKRRIFVNYESTKQTADCVSAVSWGTYVPTMGDVRSNCNSASSCTYVETTLTPWE
jgi:prepilin-type N-terminal cleavage/methylation domain-containing protein